MFFRFVRLPTGFFLRFGRMAGIIGQEINDMKIESNQRMNAVSRVRSAGEFLVMREGYSLSNIIRRII